MTHMHRLRYALYVGIVLTMLLGLAGLLVPALNAPRLFLEDYVFVPFFVIGYLVAPMLVRKVPAK